ncbi:hypothetical protein EG028_02265 [Chitinophaga barathri]|uniref:DUF4105 domain-containing protein n=3 Tax=Chitinophaga barathri TaxID=1647451 RepID=A0A3N4MGZ4_9BACT|nr:hypothetical protein EG028_02265 [Chitinophaga barathri]
MKVIFNQKCSGKYMTCRILTFIAACMILILSCRKQPAASDPTPIIQVPMDSPVSQFFSALQSNDEAWSLVERLEKAYGPARWTDALAKTGGERSICILPMAYSGADTVSALLALELKTSIRIKVIDAGDFPVNTPKSAKSETGRLLHFINFRTFGAQGLSGQRIKFDHKNVDSLLQSADASRMAQMTMSVCYHYSACTGDGFGNCVGNYSFYTECYSSTTWFDDYSYIDMPIYGGDIDGSPRPGSGGGTGSGSSTLAPPLKRIDDPAAYLCFDRTQPAVLTIYVDQPLPGADDPFTVLGKMGHAFISIEQPGQMGVSRRFIGFYPQTPVNPFGNTAAPAALGNDEGKKHDVRLPIALTPSQLQKVLDAILTYQEVYDLESYNCTDFCMDVAQAAGILIPRNSGWWIFGRGRNPGRMGEDMRAMPGVITKGGRSMRNTGNCD